MVLTNSNVYVTINVNVEINLLLEANKKQRLTANDYNAISRTIFSLFSSFSFLFHIDPILFSRSLHQFITPLLSLFSFFYLVHSLRYFSHYIFRSLSVSLVLSFSFLVSFVGLHDFPFISRFPIAYSIDFNYAVASIFHSNSYKFPSRNINKHFQQLRNYIRPFAEAVGE